MTKALPFTEASIARAIRGAEKAGKRVAAIQRDTRGLVELVRSAHEDWRGGPPSAGD